MSHCVIYSIHLDLFRLENIDIPIREKGEVIGCGKHTGPNYQS